MNFPNVLNQLGLLIAAMSGVLALLAVVSLGLDGLPLDAGTGEHRAFMPLLLSGAMGGVLGGAMVLVTRKRSKYIGRREALLLVALSWFLGAALAGMPYFMWAHMTESQVDSPFRSFVDCYFEAMSGLTTTGATVLSDIDQLPPSLLLWRSLTHWFGGLGIVVLFVAVLPSLGVGGKKLFRVEATGPSPEGLQPTIREAARVLWYIYAGFTAVSAVALWMAGMTPFDGLCHSLSMVSTGGLSTRDASIGHYNSNAIEIIGILVMVLAGVNFALFYAMTQRRWKTVYKDAEVRFYLALKLVIIAVVACDLLLEGSAIVLVSGEQLPQTTWMAVREAAFTTVALHTGTGMCTADYEIWPYFSRSVLFSLALIGGCAGSTAGGVKVIRVWIAAKVLAAEIEKAFRPNVIRPVRVNGQVIDDRMAISAIAYIIGMVLLWLVGAMLIKLCQPGETADLQTCVSASLSTIANIGPGLHGVGPTDNYGWFTPAAKLVMCMLMALGRLELFAIVVLFSPRFWRGN